jgi:glycosyltransferase involved in cell wall biosynthesis
MRETSSRIDITRVALYPNHGSSAIGRIGNYVSFAASATALSGSALKDTDAVWVYNSPPTVGMPLFWHTRLGRKPFFLHVQDLWPDSLIDSGMLPRGRLGKIAASAMERIVRVTERRAAVIGVISQSVREIILERHPEVDPDRIVYAPNPTNESLFRSVETVRAEIGVSEKTSDMVNIMYAGAVGDVQGLDTLLDAAAMLRGRTEISITIVGDGISRARLERRADEERLTNVKFLGRVPQDAIPGLIARADVQIVSLSDAPFLAYTTPSKIASLLASGVPIIGHLAGDGARLIQDAEAGVLVSPGDATELASAIVQMADLGPSGWTRYGERGRQYYESRLSVESATATILDSLSSVININGG